MSRENIPEGALRARDKLIAQFFNHPDVEMIDVGYNLNSPGTSQIVLRVHTRLTDHSKLRLPSAVDGFPVAVITADYR